jgi:hypothetical protein
MLIGTDWKIEATDLSFVLSKKVDRTTIKSLRSQKMWAEKGRVQEPDEVKWSVEGYYSNFKNALTGMVNFGVKDTELKDMKSIMTKLDEIHSLINTLNAPPRL